MSSHRPVVLGTGLAGLLLLLTAPAPAAAVSALRRPAEDPLAPLVALLALAAWALLGWLLLTLALTLGGRLPGSCGRAARCATRRIAPAAVRRAIEVTLGLTVVAGVVGAPPASAAPGPALPAPAVASLDWAAAPAPAVDLDWAAPPVPAPALAAPPQTVVVDRGDTLWALAERDLTTRTGTAVSDAEVAQAWPSWWTANREAVGPDPDLLLPGTALIPPAAHGPASS